MNNEDQQIAKNDIDSVAVIEKKLKNSVFKNIKKLSDTSSYKSKKDSNSKSSSDISLKADSLFKKSPYSKKESGKIG